VSDVVRVRKDALQMMLRHAAESWPEECCGLLLGRADRIEDALPARNAAEDRARRFLVDPVDHFHAIRQARARGLAIVGAYHSHPNTEPAPSPTDRREAYDDRQFIHVIVRPPSGAHPAPAATVAAYRLAGDDFVRLQLDVVGEAEA
jgi:proteasome lid subunit RPN8/RPN11